MATYFGNQYTNIGTETDPVWDITGSGAVSTNLGATHGEEDVDITSSSGTSATLNAAVASAGATPGTAGVMTDGDKEKLDGLVSNATHTGDVTGSTALTIANNAVTTDKINLRAVTLDKVQLVGNMTALGNVSGGLASPSSVTILDQDTMSSNSATSLATQQSIKAYVDSKVVSVVSKYSTGWLSSHGGITVANGSTHTITHSLGTTDITIEVFVATNSSGANSVCISTMGDNRGFNNHGYSSQISNLGTNTFVLQLGSDGYESLSSTGTTSSATFASKFIKVVVVG